MASGWMTIRGHRRRRSVDRGFPISDHVDWRGLFQAITASRAETIWVTHGFTDVVTRYLKQKGYAAQSLSTRFGEEAPEDIPAGATDAEWSENESKKDAIEEQGIDTE